MAINGSFYPVDGTSASCPVVAAMISLVNSARVKLNQPTLGWINPTIYSKAYHIFNDITVGQNNCLRIGGKCCSEGFRATPGWDPVTGWGSINFRKFHDFFLSIKTGNYDRKHFGRFRDDEVKRREGYLFLASITVSCLLILYCFYCFFRSILRSSTPTPISETQYGSINESVEDI